MCLDVLKEGKGILLGKLISPGLMTVSAGDILWMFYERLEFEADSMS